MFDQFNQDFMVMLVQMLSAMQQEQVALIREEMRHFQEATEELAAFASTSRPPRRFRRPTAPPLSPSRWAPGTWPGARSDTPPAAGTPARPPAPKTPRCRLPQPPERNLRIRTTRLSTSGSTSGSRNSRPSGRTAGSG